MANRQLLFCRVEKYIISKANVKVYFAFIDFQVKYLLFLPVQLWGLDSS